MEKKNYSVLKDTLGCDFVVKLPESCRNRQIKILQITDPQLIASPDTVSASADGYFLYIKVDFYRRTMGENDIDFHKSSIFTYDMAQRGFTGSIDIPHTYMAAENGGKSISIDRLETIYQLLGVHGSDILFLASPVSSHLIARLEVTTNPDGMKEEYEVEE